ncbi:MAG TPA: riboflavin synthase, partial [Dehalococcoidia bacterium]|nr:riboflavin synthase [Dehalococcoidia bacterium]
AIKALEGMKRGDSLAVNGACLTVTGLDAGSFSMDVMPETLRHTNLGLLRPGSRVNLERALIIGGRLGGHFVQGHVDATGRVVSLLPEAEALIARYAAPPEVMRYIVEKGFIAVDGVSLTVICCDTTSFSASLVTYTRENTILGNKRPGDSVNLEVDIMAKYVEQLKERRGITLDFLAERGFLSPSQI